MPDHPDATASGAFGRAVEEWNQRLDGALAAGDPGALQGLLGELHDEMGHEADAVERGQAAPKLDRLVEQARRLVQAAPTDLEALEGELAAERAVWAGYRRRYREAFVPAMLHPFVSSSAVFLRPAADGVQFEGFDKFAGHGEGDPREAVTLLLRRGAGSGGGTPANFFSIFEARGGRFTVQRAYRTELPRGAGRACLAEHLAWLVPEPGALRELVWDNVQNSGTYAGLVEGQGGDVRVRAGVELDELPLGRCSRRLLDELGLRVAGVRPLLDGFGFLDLVLDVEPG